LVLCVCFAFLFFCVFFFFQAEDGIRDFHVTGVQTCALPILRSWLIANVNRLNTIFTAIAPWAYNMVFKNTALRRVANRIVGFHRSEERRVGKSVDLGGRRSIKRKKTQERMNDN